MTSLARIDLRRNARHGMTAYGADEAGRRYAHLIACGFDEAEADTVFEAIDLPDSAAISLRISDLRALGFADPVKMITTLPPILGYALDNIRGKISDLRALGFADPVKMITSSPTILSYAIDNIRGKISDLRALGFADPVKMITTLPRSSATRASALCCAAGSSRLFPIDPTECWRGSFQSRDMQSTASLSPRRRTGMASSRCSRRRRDDGNRTPHQGLRALHHRHARPPARDGGARRASARSPFITASYLICPLRSIRRPRRYGGRRRATSGLPSA